MRPALAPIAALASVLFVACGSSRLPSAADGPPSTTPRWAPAARIDDAAREDIGAYLAVSAQGRVIAILRGSRTGRGIVSQYGQRSSRYTNATGWSAGEVLPFDFASDLSDSVTIDDAGVARAVGTVGTGTTRDDFARRVWWSRAPDGAAWSAPEIVPAPGRYAYRPTIVGLDRALDLATWLDLGPDAANSLWASLRLEGIGWTPAQRLSAEGARVDTASVAANGRGQAVVVWPVTPGASPPLFARAFDRASGWTEAERIGSSAWESAVAFVEGHALALWTNPDGLFMSVRREDGSWTPESFGPRHGELVFYLRLAMDGVGRAIALWQQSDGAGGYPLYGASYDPRAGWSAAQLLASLEYFNVATHQVVLDRAGRGVATWVMSGRLCALTYDPGAGWAHDGDCFAAGTGMDIATDAAGHVIAAWPFQGAIWYSTLDLGGR